MNKENQDGKKWDGINSETKNSDGKKSGGGNLDGGNPETDGIAFLKKLNHLDASLVAEAEQGDSILHFRKRRRLKFVAAAVLLMICLTAGGGIVAASVFGIQIFNMKSDEGTSSYDVGFVARCRRQDAFRGHINEIKAVIQKQCEEYKMWDSSIPNLWSQKFDDWESALAYLEIDFMEVPITSRPPTSVKLRVVGTKEGPLQSVQFDCSYLAIRYNVYVTANIFVGDSEEEVPIQMFAATGGEVSYTGEVYTTAKGITCMLMDTAGSEEYGSTAASGYMVKDGIMYFVNAVPQQRNGEKGENRMEIVKELLEEIAGK